MGTCVRGRLRSVVLQEGSPADPGAYIVNEPPGAFNVGEVIFLGPDKFVRVLKMDGPPEG